MLQNRTGIPYRTQSKFAGSLSDSAGHKEPKPNNATIPRIVCEVLDCELHHANYLGISLVLSNVFMIVLDSSMTKLPLWLNRALWLAFAFVFLWPIVDFHLFSGGLQGKLAKYRITPVDMVVSLDSDSRISANFTVDRQYRRPWLIAIDAAADVDKDRIAAAVGSSVHLDWTLHEDGQLIAEAFEETANSTSQPTVGFYRKAIILSPFRTKEGAAYQFDATVTNDGDVDFGQTRLRNLSTTLRHSPLQLLN